jgi:hypothetical protein
MSKIPDVSPADEPAAVRVRDLDQYFPGISNSFKYGQRPSARNVSHRPCSVGHPAVNSQTSGAADHRG